MNDRQSTIDYIYLHGFASSPRSQKARYLFDRFAEIGIKLNVLDLDCDDFSNLTLTRQIEQTIAELPPDNIPVTLIGSSFGGLTAAWVAEKASQVKHLILLAPAFDFLAHWLPKIGDKQHKQWQESGYLSVYHYGAGKLLPLSYQFLVDASQYDDSKLIHSIDTLILHGKYDEVIPIEASYNYQQQRDRVTLIPLNSDHSMTDSLELIWQEITNFEFKNRSKI
jgi:pimeloyl-ACP methyl ester carboxylesterase